MAERVYEVGAVLESKDRKYEPDRRIRLVQPLGRRWLVVTTANPNRPHRIGVNARISVETLRSRWQAPTVVCDSCGGAGGSAAHGTVCADCGGAGRKADPDA